MLVLDLVKRLKKMPQDAEVIIEGCDCIGDIGFVILQDNGDVLLARTDGDWQENRRVGG